MLQRSLSGSSLPSMRRPQMTMPSRPTLQRSNSGTSLFSSGSQTPLSVASPMARAMKGFRSGVSGEKHAHGDQDVMQEEVGEWRYLVVDTSGIRPREDASYSGDTKGKGDDKRGRLQEGTIVTIDKRRTAGWTTWLGLASGDGWVFDVSPKDKKVRMVEAEVTSGDFQYIAGHEMVPIISLPSPQQAAKAGRAFRHKKIISPGQTVDVLKRIRPVMMKGTFLMLADGSGWTVDHMEGRQVMQLCGCPEGSDALPGSAGPALAPLDGASVRDAERGAAEFGTWDYVVVDPKGQTLRSEPTYDPKSKIAARVEDGEVVSVTERRPGDGTTFLRLASPQGWVFDCQPGSKARVRMTPVTVERGHWFYAVSAQNGIALRNRCSFSEDSKVGTGPCRGTLVPIVERMKVGETTFLHMEAGGHWIFDRKGGRQLMDGPLAVETPPKGTMGVVQADSGITLLLSPTAQRSAVTRMMLLPGARVHVLSLCEAEGRWWGRVSKGGQSSMEGWLATSNLQIDPPALRNADALHGSSPTSPVNADAAQAIRRCFSADEVRDAWGASNPRVP